MKGDSPLPVSFWASDIFLRLSSTLRTSFFLMTLREACACSVSRETLSGSVVSESTMPFMKLRYLRSEVTVGSAPFPMRALEESFLLCKEVAKGQLSRGVLANS